MNNRFFYIIRPLILALTAWLSVIPVYAQGIRLTGLGGPYPAPVEGSGGAGARVMARSLPFFDDFSTVRSQADPALWLPSGGTFVNNTIGLNPPSVNVATFDGLGANGLPYASPFLASNQLAYGPTDTLTSQPIDLSAQKDSVYLSFYWQRQGLGELPDPGDSLRLQFLDNTNAWRTVWKQDGGRPDTVFYQVLQPILGANLHSAFQFRFQAWGRQSGAYDTWHIDYVYLDKKRTSTARSRFIRDLALQRTPGSYLKRYTAMPLSHYLLNPTAETIDSVRTTVKNLDAVGTFNTFPYRFSVRNQTTGQALSTTPLSSILRINGSQQLTIVGKPVPFADSSRSSAVLKYTFALTTSDSASVMESGQIINLARNDTISATVTLADYYAYDDGSAEYAVQVGINERAATRFVSAKPTAIVAVRGYVGPFNASQTGQSVTFQVYGVSQGKPGALLFQQVFPISYAATRNGLVEFKFSRAVVVKDTFFIGWQQISNDPSATVRLGFDKNSPFKSQLFYSPGTVWSQNGSSPALNLSGAVMLRPVVSNDPKDLLVTAIEEPTPTDLRVYPNPTTGRVQWDTPALRQIEVFDLTGRLCSTLPIAPGQRSADLNLPVTGLYLLRLSDGTRTVSQRILVD